MALSDQRHAPRLHVATGLEASPIGEVLVEESADLILRLDMKEGDWNDGGGEVVAGPAVLSGFLWMGTGFGGWWVPDRTYSTRSRVEKR